MVQLAVAGLGAAAGWGMGGMAATAFTASTGAQWGWAIGSVLGSLIGHGGGEDTKTVGPRVNELRASTSSYGITIPRGWGTFPAAGNMIWSPDLIETVHTQETSSGGKGGGGGTTHSSTYYTYSCNAAWGICEGPITAIRRIWFNTELVYDVSGDSEQVLKEGLTLRVYEGTTDQEPDPKMQSIVGIADTPAYRKLCYITVEDLQLSNYGNSRPNIRVEVVKEAPLNNIATDFHDYTDYITSHTQHDPITGWTYYGTSYVGSPPTVAVYAEDGTQIAFWYLPTMQNYLDQPQRCEIEGMFNGRMFGHYNWDNNHRVLIQVDPMSGAVIGFTQKMMKFNVARMDVSANWVVYPVTVGVGEEVQFWDPTTLIDYGAAAKWDNSDPPQFVHLGSITPAFGFTVIDAQKTLVSIEPDTGYIWVSTGLTSNAQIHLIQASIRDEYLAGMSLNKWDFSKETRSLQSTVGLTWNQYVFVYDPATQSIIAQQTTDDSPTYLDIGTYRLECTTRHDLDTLTIAASYIGLWTANQYSWLGHPLSGDGYYYKSAGGGHLLHIDKYRTSDLTLVEEYNFPDSPNWIQMYSGCFPDKQIAYGAAYLQGAWTFKWGRIDPGAIDLQELTEAICEDHGLDIATEIEATDLGGTSVRGYVINSPTTGRAQLEVLMGAYVYNAVESDKKIKFQFHNQASAVSIPVNDLAAHILGGAQPDKFPLIRREEHQLPKAVHVSYISREREYEPNVQPSNRQVTDSRDIRRLQFGVVMSDDEAAQCAEKWDQIIRAERHSGEISLSTKYLKYDPTDVMTVPRGGEDYDVFITAIRWAGPGLLHLTFTTYDEEAWDSDTAGDGGTYTASTIVRVPMSGFFMVDGPSLMATHDDAGFYAAFFPVGATSPWPGGSLNRSAPPTGDWRSIQEFLAESTVGYTTEVLADQPRWTVWDHDNTLNIRVLNSKTFEDKTRLEVLDGANALFFPWTGELIQFMSKTLESDGSYTISGLLRGRKGTSWATGLHVQSEPVVLLYGITTYRISDVIGNIGKTFDYRAVTFGKSLTDVSSTSLTQNGVAIKPIAPAHLSVVIESNGDVTSTWFRSARLNHGWNDSIDVPLDEPSEKYDITYTVAGTLVHTERITTAEHTYLFADQQEESQGGALEVNVYQISDRLGRGYPAINTDVTLALWTDFSEYGVGTVPADWIGSQPNDWTEFGNDAFAVWEMHDLGAGEYLWSDRGGNGENFLHWDITPQAADVEVLVRIKQGLHGSFGNVAEGGVILRADALDSSPAGYLIGFNGVSGKPEIATYTGSGVGTQIAIDDGFAIDDDISWWWFRARIIGDNIKMRYWEDGDSEPATWGLDITDTTYLSAGYVGLFGAEHAFKGPERYNYFAIAYDGATAPGP